MNQVVNELHAYELYRRVDAGELGFKSTHDLEPLHEIIGQPRAKSALEFGINIPSPGHNIFAYGQAGVGKNTLIRQSLAKRAENKSTPEDLCYVNNFDDSTKPLSIKLPAGKGKDFQKDMEQLTSDVQSALTQAFDGRDFQKRRKGLAKEISESENSAFEKIQEKAWAQGVTLQSDQQGILFIPIHEDGSVYSRQEIESLNDERRRELEEKASKLEEELEEISQETPRKVREVQKKIRALERTVASQAINPLVEDIKNKYQEHEKLKEYLERAKEDMIENGHELLKSHHAQNQKGFSFEQGNSVFAASQNKSSSARRYKVNVIVDNSSNEGAPIIYEDNPTFFNLVGKVDYVQQMGALIADFNQVRAGALHRANGGYLILDADRVLAQPFVWDTLKRCLKAEKVTMWQPSDLVGFVSTVSLAPEPIDLDVKVIITGSPRLYYLLYQYDPDFPELFKVPADFSDRMERKSGEDLNYYSRLIATIAQKEELLPFNVDAVCRVIEHSSRLADDGMKLSLSMRKVVDLLRESHYRAKTREAKEVSDVDIKESIDLKRWHCNRGQEQIHEAIERGLLLIDTQRKVSGQINGMSIFSAGEYDFGRPHRITAQVGLGNNSLVDIEREVEFGGPTHTKGVLILKSFLTGRYAKNYPLSFSASLVFEQSYTPIEGDSASLAELCVLLSAISKTPLRQDLAITGSVNQHGEVQPVGGVNAKIEGFFQACQVKGLNGTQGMIIPKSNCDNLMVDQEVIDAVTRGDFHIYAVENIDQTLEVLSELEAGNEDSDGQFPEGSFNHNVIMGIKSIADRWKELMPASANKPSASMSVD